MLRRYRQDYSPLTELHQTLNRLMEPAWFGNDNSDSFGQMISSVWAPSIDVKDEPGQYVVKADIPGVDPKNIDINLKNGLLTIKGHKETEKKEESKNYVCIERSHGSFCRNINLPDIVDASKINAKSKNGVLEIVIPKSKEAGSHKIQVKEE